MYAHCKRLEDLWKEVDRLQRKAFPKQHLVSIVGDGKAHRPRFMFVFINPTARNISADPAWKGPRFPFIGTKDFWRVFYRAGLFDASLIKYIEKNKKWSVPFTQKVLRFLRRHNYYFTNVVKLTGTTAKLPTARQIKLFLPILQREIELVQPTYIITFGVIPFERLAKKKIRMKDYYHTLMETKHVHVWNVTIGYFHGKITPCYFPMGRGEPKKAVEMLRMIHAKMSS